MKKMRKNLLFICTVALLLVPAQVAWAQTDIWTESDLRKAVAQGGDIRLQSKIGLNDKLDIPEGVELTIDLNSNTLTRMLNAMPENPASGSVIMVHPNASVTITDNSEEKRGLITGGYTDNGGGIYNCGKLKMWNIRIADNSANSNGGGIYNLGELYLYDCTIADNWTAVDGGGIWNGGSLLLLERCTVDNNTARAGGAGIWSKGNAMITNTKVTGNNRSVNGGGLTNHGVMMLSDCQVTDNSATDYGAGIYQGSPLDGSILREGKTALFLNGANTISGNSCMKGGSGIFYYEGKLQMRGKQVVKDNVYDDLYLTAGKKISVPEDGFESGADIYVKLETEGVFTEGYSQTDVAADSFFSSTNHVAFEYVGGEVSIRVIGYKYIERKWNSSAHAVEATTKIVDPTANHDISRWSGDDITLTGIGHEVYVVSRNATFETIDVPSGNVVDLILCDGATLKVTKGVHVPSGASLTIYGQKDDGGIIDATSDSRTNAGIGGHEDEGSGWIIIHGGKIFARGGTRAAGIGGGQEGSCGDVIIYGGYVAGYGGDNGAGIGGGVYGGVWRDCKIEIYGGDVIATSLDGAAIGTGDQTQVLFSGFYTQATQDGPINIYGGKVTALTTGKGCGIGAGGEGKAGLINIYGGVVIARVNYMKYGTAHGYSTHPIGGNPYYLDHQNPSYYGTLTMGEKMMMYAGSSADDATAVSRGDCNNYRLNKGYVRIEECRHAGGTLECDEDGIAKMVCTYCTYAKDGSVPISEFNGQTLNVKLTGHKIYKDGTWNTLCLPFSLTGEQINAIKHVYKYNGWRDYKLMTLESSSYDMYTGTLKLNFTPATDIVAGKPYIIKWAKEDGYRSDTNIYNIFYPTFSNVVIEANPKPVSTKEVDFVPIFASAQQQEGSKTRLYLGSDNKLYYPDKGVSMGAFRAFFELKNGIVAGDPAQKSK